MSERWLEDDGIDWAEVARADRAARGECWIKVDAQGATIDGWCEVHLRYMEEDGHGQDSGE